MDFQILNRSNFEKVENLKFDDSTYFEKTEFIRLESSDASILGDISQIEVFGNHIYILDKKGKSLKKFDISGKYIQDIGRAGLGPGEYIGCNAFYINPQLKTINICDPMKIAILQYDLSGKHLQTIKSNNRDLSFVTRLSMLNENEIFCFSSTNWSSNCEFSILDKDHNLKQCLYQYPVKSDRQISFITAIQPYSIKNGEVHYGQMFSDTVFRYGEYERSEYLVLESGKPAIEPLKLKEIGNNNDNEFLSTIINIGKNRKYTLGLKNFFESDSYVCCDFFEYPGYLTEEGILWNKTNNKGVYISEYAGPAPCFGSIFYSFDNVFVRVWNGQQIESFKENLKTGIDKNNYPEKVLEIIDKYNEDDENPILIFYKMKQ